MSIEPRQRVAFARPRAAVAIAVATILSGCIAFSPDGGMEPVASIALTRLDKNVEDRIGCRRSGCPGPRRSTAAASAAGRRRRSNRFPAQQGAAGGLQ